MKAFVAAAVSALDKILNIDLEPFGTLGNAIAWAMGATDFVHGNEESINAAIARAHDLEKLEIAHFTVLIALAVAWAKGQESGKNAGHEMLKKMCLETGIVSKSDFPETTPETTPKKETTVNDETSLRDRTTEIFKKYLDTVLTKSRADTIMLSGNTLPKLLGVPDEVINGNPLSVKELAETANDKEVADHALVLTAMAMQNEWNLSKDGLVNHIMTLIATVGTDSDDWADGVALAEHCLDSDLVEEYVAKFKTMPVKDKEPMNIHAMRIAAETLKDRGYTKEKAPLFREHFTCLAAACCVVANKTTEAALTILADLPKYMAAGELRLEKAQAA